MTLRIILTLIAVSGGAMAQEKPPRTNVPAATPPKAVAVATPVRKVPATTPRPKAPSSTPTPRPPAASPPVRMAPTTPAPAPSEPPSDALPNVTTRPANPAAVAPPAEEDAPTRMVAAFFGSIAKGQIDEAYATLTKGSKTIEKPEDLRVLKQKTREAIEVFGAITGHELVESQPIGTRLLRRTYLSLGAEFPLRWRFYFYNANDRWRLIDLRVDDRLAGMFDEPKEQPDESKGDRP